jgi:hypothetical protein
MSKKRILLYRAIYIDTDRNTDRRMDGWIHGWMSG